MRLGPTTGGGTAPRSVEDALADGRRARSGARAPYERGSGEREAAGHPRPRRLGVVAVTGGTAGVGRATVRAFARRGYDVGVLARGRGRLADTRDEVRAVGRDCVAVPADVAEHDEVERAARQIEDELGPVDVWVNNAMTTVFAPLADIGPEEFERATRVTYLGVVWGTMAALRRMRERGGTIVQVGSALAYRSIPLQAPYCGAKSAIRGFTDSLRTELIHTDSPVHLTMVHLPAVNTPQFEWCEARLPNRPQPVPPIYQPEVCASAIVHAAEHPRRELWVGAPTYASILGQRALPLVMDRFLADAGWGGQMTDLPLEPGRRSNLFEPVPGKQAAHGAFDEQSHGWSPALALTKRRGWVMGTVLALSVAVGWSVARRG